MKKKNNQNVWKFFVAVYFTSALLYTPILLSGHGIEVNINKALMLLICFIPSVMGIIFTYQTKDKARRKDFWRRTFRWPAGKTKYALIALAIPPLLPISAYFLPIFLTGEHFDLVYAADMIRNWQMLIMFLLVEFFLGAVSEELGWRGYALDELQNRWNPLASSLVLGIIWAFWHTPAFVIPGLAQSEMGGIFSCQYLSFLVSVTAGNVLHTWAYNHTGRSILVAGILMHFVQNATMVFLGGIFDRFSVPAGYYLVLPIVTILAVVIVSISPGADMVSKPSKLHSSSVSL